MPNPVSLSRRTDPGIPALTAEKLCYRYGSRNLLTDISLSLDPGKLYGVLGPNGSGKTTLLELLAGYRTPISGRVCLGNRPLREIPPTERARWIGWVPQQAVIGFPFTVRDVVMMGRHPHIPRFRSPGKRDREAVDLAIHCMDLAGRSQSPITHLSGGERQRSLIARVLAQDPRLYMLDEVCTGLDIAHTLCILDLLRHKADHDGVTGVLVLHDMNQALQYCDALFLLSSGVLCAQGPPETVLTDERIASVFQVTAHRYPAAKGQPPFITFTANQRPEDR
ncbi:MAG: ABC transporter [Deltaproteobacteria bacterium]|nr:MAG: ABC transporter [Deltaproteobacteria bacterium]